MDHRGSLEGIICAARAHGQLPARDDRIQAGAMRDSIALCQRGSARPILRAAQAIAGGIIPKSWGCSSAWRKRDIREPGSTGKPVGGGGEFDKIKRMGAFRRLRCWYITAPRYANWPAATGTCRKNGSTMPQLRHFRFWLSR
jgi:hypothetical protein